ncbi:hydroxyphenylacetyl-CoA thioesterase PaaI [Alkalicoccus urumqiensis]|uniref:Phenylacetic acid degradation protein PaaD n=1 Tax=Alkalicoccus urumqiensis TaxID=1548213 RepID=A0A2P6MDZ2_ALKUR|nr:hydroxyphenylacetyl-CoA thioesterase PaaI [Alkalicoccus urumqiensis]PRO64501.1 phenylacetic acid degradation protein PaaD [Alkalicoccus urumqiensis]
MTDTASLNAYLKTDPYASFLGIEVEDVGEGTARASVTVTEDMLNIHGTANGGLLFSLADVVFACASNSYGTTAVGIQVSMQYLEAVACGETLRAEAVENAEPGRTGSYRMEVRTSSGSLAALAEGLVYRTRRPVLGEVSS